MTTIYSQPQCVQCSATYRLMDKLNIPYQVVDVSQDSEAMAFVKSLGYNRAPIVVTDEKKHWSGFDPDRIKELAV